MRKTILLLAALAVAFSFTAAFAADEKPAVVYGTNVGDQSQPVEIKSIDGKTAVNTGELKKKTVFMLVSSVCTACNAELQEVAANLDAFGDKDVFAVVIDVDPTRASQALAKFNIPMLSDADWKLGSALGLTSAPSVAIVETNGKIAYKKYGYTKDQWKQYAK